MNRATWPLADHPPKAFATVVSGKSDKRLQRKQIAGQSRCEFNRLTTHSFDDSPRVLKCGLVDDSGLPLPSLT